MSQDTNSKDLSPLSHVQGLARGKEHVREHPKAQRRPGRPGLAKYLPPDACEDRAMRNEAICRAYLDGRFTQREIGDFLGLHYVTVSCIIRAKEKEQARGAGHEPRH